MLDVRGLSVRYGSVTAVESLDLHVGRGDLVALLGANGAGKSSTLNAVAGLLPSAAGRVVLDGEDVTGRGAHKIARNGMALVPEGRLIVATLTVEDNLMLSRFATKHRAAASLEQVYDLFPRLSERRRQFAGLMSGGEQQMLAIGRALMTSPKMLLLDEPSMGLSPALVETVFQGIQAIQEMGVTILLVEQNAALAFPIAEHVYILERGQIVLQGTPQELETDSQTVARFLGIEEDPSGPGVDDDGTTPRTVNQ